MKPSSRDHRLSNETKVVETTVLAMNPSSRDRSLKHETKVVEITVLAMNPSSRDHRLSTLHNPHIDK